MVMASVLGGGWRGGLRITMSDGHIKRCADFTHALAAQRSQPDDQHRDRDALDRIEIHGAWTWYGILAGFEKNLARQPSDCCGAGGDKHPT